MPHTLVKSMIAIGRSGQLGLNGHLPWEGNSESDYVADVARFFESTRGHVLLAGPRTIGAVPEFAYRDRTIQILRSNMNPEQVLLHFIGRTVFIGGGPAVWDAYAPYIEHWDINRLPYDGPADTWFKPEWLIAGGKQPRE
jgi:dihydromethanopterin reductase